MNYCNDCNSFVEGKTYGVSSESIDPPETVCELCGSEDIEAAKDCPYCDGYMRYEDDMCEDCEKSLDGIISEAIKSIEEEFLIDYKEAKYILTNRLED